MIRRPDGSSVKAAQAGGPIAAADITDAGAAFPAFAQAETAAAQAALLAETVLVKSPDGSLWRLGVSNDGLLSQTKT
jgi:hypothetical protein